MAAVETMAVAHHCGLNALKSALHCPIIQQLYRQEVNQNEGMRSMLKWTKDTLAKAMRFIRLTFLAADTSNHLHKKNWAFSYTKI